MPPIPLEDLVPTIPYHPHWPYSRTRAYTVPYLAWDDKTAKDHWAFKPITKPGVPTPADPKLSVFGFAFASAITSFTELAGTPRLVTSTLGVVATSVIGAKSRSASYESFLYRLTFTA